MREHQFLAASGNIDYTFERVKGVANILFGGTGFFIDKFKARKRTACCGCTGTATCSRRSWSRGADRHRAGRLAVQGPRREDGDEHATAVRRRAGGDEPRHEPVHRPGKVGMQSMYLHMPSAE